MLHHVSLEVTRDELDRSAAFWRLFGFVDVEAPEPLGNGSRWLARSGTQVHLLVTETPVVPPSGHTAVLVDDFEETLAGLERAGFGVRPGREYWGEPRAKVLAPCGHVVELMSAPPP